MSSKETAVRFARLHVRGSPLLLCDAADVGSFKAMACAGATAIATATTRSNILQSGGTT